MNFLKTNWLPILMGIIFSSWILIQLVKPSSVEKSQVVEEVSAWVGPGKYQIPIYTDSGKLIAYGRDLIENTSKYLGPRGSVLQITNGMNCQNCHLDAGTKPFGNNYGAVFSMYPKFRDRSGAMESIFKRVNDCLQRSLNGKALDTNSKEMQAILAYMKWVGGNVLKGEKPIGSGIVDLPFLNRAADPVKGNAIYINKCQTCHGADGRGKKSIDEISFTYPPLWGNQSYNTGAGLFRITRFAGYVKNNMPFGVVSYHNPQLTNEEAWDVAAFVNSQPRPAGDIGKDWPDISKKPFDHPFGPYTDSFSEIQHKYGPFLPIKTAKEEAAKNKKQTK